MSDDETTAADERLYTLEQAKKIIADSTCRSIGHDLDIVKIDELEPVNLICSRCGRVWAVRVSAEDAFQLDYWKISSALCRAVHEISANHGVDHDALANNLTIELDKVYPSLDWSNVLTDQWPLRPDEAKT